MPSNGYHSMIVFLSLLFFFVLLLLFFLLILHNVRNHSLDVKVGEDDFNSLSDKSVEEVVALRIPRVETRKVWTPKRPVGSR